MSATSRLDGTFKVLANHTIQGQTDDEHYHIDRKTLPSAGTILADLTQGKLGGAEHDRAAPERLKATLY